MKTFLKKSCLILAALVSFSLASCSNDDDDIYEFINVVTGNYSFVCDAVGIQDDVVVVLEEELKGSATVKRNGDDLVFYVDGDTDKMRFIKCADTTDKSGVFFRVEDGQSDNLTFKGHAILSAEMTNGDEHVYHGFYEIATKELYFFIETEEDGVNVILRFTAKKK